MSHRDGDDSEFTKLFYPTNHPRHPHFPVKDLVPYCQSGEFLHDTIRDDEEISAGLAGCLFGQAKDVEAHAIIDPILAKYGYGTPMEQLTRKARSDVAKLLFVMGKTDEASKYQRVP